MNVQNGKQRIKEQALHLYNLYTGGLIALILVILQAILGIDRADIWLSITIDAFAIALPFLGGLLVVNLMEERYPYGTPRSLRTKLLSTCFTIGIASTFIGLDTAFWHISWLAGVLCIVAILFISIICIWYILDLEAEPDTPNKDKV